MPAGMFRLGLLLKEVYSKLYRTTLDGLSEPEEEFWGGINISANFMGGQQILALLKAAKLEQPPVLNRSLRSGVGPPDGGWGPNMAATFCP